MVTHSSRAFFIIGDSFLIDEKVRALTQKIEKENGGEMAQQIIHLSDTPLSSVLIQARTLPFLSSAQIFRLREIQKLNKKDLEDLEAYLKNPFDKTYLIFENHSPDRANDLICLMKSFGQVIHIQEDERKPATLQFAREKLKRSGKTMTKEAFESLDQMVGAMPLFLDSMIERLIAFAGEKNQITEDMVETFEEHWVKSNVFQLTDAISERKLSKALSLLKEFLDENEKDVIGLIGVLHWQIKRLWLAAVLLEDGESQEAVARKCRISPRQVPLVMRQVKSFSKKRIEQALETLFQLDWRMKSGRADGPTALESWLIQAIA